MGWKEKHTPLYNLATHSMKKIKKAFDPETGQVHKDDRGRLKLLEVVDWPVSAGLTGGAELNDFFKWAEHLNNYHPEVKDISHDKVLKGYNSLRYQTKPYDERTKCLSVFSEDQWEFLERYRWLCQVKEFFKPEDLFCVMNNAEAENEADQKLQNFDIENERIRCPNTTTLHALIPYVKRLVGLFPQIKDEVKEQLSSAQIRNTVYQQLTQRYVKKTDQCGLEFNPGALGLRNFLTGDQQIWLLQMVDGNSWTGLTKVYRILQNTSCTPNYYSDGHYTILKLKRLLRVNRMINFNALLASIETPHLLMIACGTNQPVNDEQRDMFKEMFSILKQKKNMKIILTTQSESDIADFIRQITAETLGEGFITTDGRLTWSELTDSSKRKMLEKSVFFQGRRVALNQLTSAESMTDSFTLTDLLQVTELRIGEEPAPPAGSGYNEKYYIDRTFSNSIVIRHDISTDKHEGKFSDLFASTEQEFKQLCQNNPTRNVHWLVKEKSGDLIWKQSQGDLKILRKYIDAQKSQSYAPSDLDKFLEQATQHRVTLIADKAGMGKTTILTHLSKRIKQKYPAHWLVRIDLNNYTELLKAQKGKRMDKGWVLEFVSKEVLKLESHLEKELFKKSFEGNEIRRVVVMVDGFDEVSPNYKDTVIDMLQVLKQTPLEQLWVTTRPHLRQELEDNLQQLSYTLQPFSEVEQVEFLKKFWLQTLNLEVNNQHKFQIYAEALIRKLAQSISDKDREFTGIPLQSHMLAEAFKAEFISFYLSEKTEPGLPQKLDLLVLYRRFIDRKYDIYYGEKSKTPAGNMAAEEQQESYFKCMQEQHQLLALQALFADDQVTFLKIDHHSTFSDEQLARIGIVQRNNEGKPQFIHRTFAEFYVADFLINHLTKKTKPHPQLQELLVSIILLRTDCHVIRAFLNGLLEKCSPTKEVLKEYGDKLDEQWNETEVNGILIGFKSVLQEAATEDNANIIGFLLDSLNSGEHSKLTKKMLLAEDNAGRTAWHLAAENDNVKALKQIWEWAEVSEKKEQLNANDLKNKLLLAEDRYGYTACHRAAARGSLEALETLWILAMEMELNPEDLLLSQHEWGYTVWQVAVEEFHLEILKKLWVWANEVQPNPKALKIKMLLTKDRKGYTAWHRAAEKGSLEALETLWSWAMEAELNPEELLLTQSGSGYTAWQMATKNLHLEVLKKLWDWTKEMTPNRKASKIKLLLAKDTHGYTAWHRAAAKGSLEALETLWVWGMEAELNPEELLLNQNEWVYTAWQVAVEEFHPEILKKLWVWTKKEQSKRKTLEKKLLLAKDQYGHTAWHRAAKKGNLEALEVLWSWAKEVELNPEDLLLDQNKNGHTAWLIAAQEIHLEVMKKLWVWAQKVQPNQNVLKINFFLTQDEYGYTTWHLAAAEGCLEALETLWSWAKEVGLNPEELLLTQSGSGYTAWQLAAQELHLEVLKKLWVWAKNAPLNPNELRNKLLLARDKYGYTALHRAAKKGSLEASEILWSWVKEVELNSEEFLLDQGDIGYTAWQLAAQELHVEVLKKLWDWAKEVLPNPKALKFNLLLAKDRHGYTAWHRAAEKGSLEALETLWSWAKEAEINTDELLLAQSSSGYTAWQMAARELHLEVLKKLWVWANEVQPNPNALKIKLFLAGDMHGYVSWHRAAKKGNLEALQILWSWAEEVEINGVDFLSAENMKRNNALDSAAKRGHFQMLQKLWDWAKEEKLKPNLLKNEILLSKDKDGNTAIHLAAKNGKLEALERLWSWAKDVQLKLVKLLLLENKHGYISWQLAAVNLHLDIMKKHWEWAKEVQLNPNELKNKLLLSKDSYGYTSWQRAAREGNLEALQTLWIWAKEAEINPDDLRTKWLLAEDKRGETVWNMAAVGNHEEVLNKLWVWAREAQLNPNELKNNLLLAKGRFGNTVWHRAAERGSLEALEILWSWAKEVGLNTVKMKKKLWLAKNEDGETAWDIAVTKNDVDVLEKLWGIAKEVKLNRNVLKNNLLLAKDRNGRTTWHRAAERGNLHVLETLWGWAKEAGINTVEMNELLLAKNKYGETAWYIAATENNIDVLEKLWVWVKEVKLNRNEIKNKLLLAKDWVGITAWHRTAARGNFQALEKLWSWAKEAGLNTVEMKNEFLLAKDKYGQTAWEVAARNKNEDVLEKLWEFAAEANLTRNELKNIQKLALKIRVAPKAEMSSLEA